MVVIVAMVGVHPLRSVFRAALRIAILGFGLLLSMVVDGQGCVLPVVMDGQGCLIDLQGNVVIPSNISWKGIWQLIICF